MTDLLNSLLVTRQCVAQEKNGMAEKFTRNVSNFNNISERKPECTRMIEAQTIDEWQELLPAEEMKHRANMIVGNTGEATVPQKISVPKLARTLNAFIQKIAGRNLRPCSERAAMDYLAGYRTTIPSHHLDAARRATQKQVAARKAAEKVESANDRIDELERQLIHLEQQLLHISPDFHREQINGLRASRGQVRLSDCADRAEDCS